MFKRLNYDLERILNEDPAAKSKIEVLLLYPCIHALIAYRISHFFICIIDFFWRD
ncbi:serine acetyltransferase [Clostridium saccharobutylicum]|nr:serine acetyltransferase [Clostridium saccharobutylicum]